VTGDNFTPAPLPLMEGRARFIGKVAEWNTARPMFYALPATQKVRDIVIRSYRINGSGREAAIRILTTKGDMSRAGAEALLDGAIL